MRELYFLDPHTWVSSVPADIVEKLKGEQSRVEDYLSTVGRTRWIQSLADESVRMPKFKGQAAYRSFIAEDMDEDRILLLAVSFTRIQVAHYLRHHAAGLGETVRGRNPVEELQSLAIGAVKTLFHWQWIAPFSGDGRFDFDLWEHPGNIYY